MGLDMGGDGVDVCLVFGHLARSVDTETSQFEQHHWMVS